MFSTNFLSLLAWEGSMSCSDESLLSEGCCGVTMAGRPRFSFFCLLRKRGYSTLAVPSKKCKIIYLILVVKYIPPDNLWSGIIITITLALVSSLCRRPFVVFGWWCFWDNLYVSGLSIFSPWWAFWSRSFPHIYLEKKKNEGLMGLTRAGDLFFHFVEARISRLVTPLVDISGGMVCFSTMSV